MCKIFSLYFIQHNNNRLHSHNTGLRGDIYLFQDLTWGMPSFFRAHSAPAEEYNSGTSVKFESQIVSKPQILCRLKGISREELDFMVAEKNNFKCLWKTGTVNIINFTSESVFLHHRWQRIKKAKKINIYDYLEKWFVKICSIVFLGTELFANTNSKNNNIHSVYYVPSTVLIAAHI